MAVTKLLRIKETSGKNPAAHLKKNLFYLCKPEKTGGGIWVGGNAGTSPEVIYATFLRNKEAFGKPGGTQAFHYTLSFPPGCGITEEVACQVAEEFCRMLLKDRHYYVYAVHNDKAHLHVHITFDSVSKEDGYKFHSPKGDWEKRIQPITDALCEKYRLPTLQYKAEDKIGRDYGQWKAGNLKGGWEDILRDDLDEGIRRANRYEDFLSFLLEEGYQIRDGKHLSLTPPGSKRAIRSGRLGRGYGKEEIRQRIQDKTLGLDLEKQYRTYGNREEIRRILYLKAVRVKNWRMTPFQRRFLTRWNQTYFLRRPRNRKRIWQYKKDILEVETLTDAIRYLVEEDIQSLEDLQEREKKLQKEADALKRRKEVLRTKLTKSRLLKQAKEIRSLLEEVSRHPDPEKEKRLALLQRSLPCASSLLGQLEALEKERQSLRQLQREKKKEQELVEEIFRLFYDLKKRSQKEEEPHSFSKKGEKAAHARPLEGQTRITIHQKLFQETTATAWITRIPYQKDTYVCLPKEDCRLLPGEEILEVYLKDEQTYCLKNRSGTWEENVLGRELKKHYEDKTKRKGGKERDGRTVYGKANHPDPVGGNGSEGARAL